MVAKIVALNACLVLTAAWLGGLVSAQDGIQEGSAPSNKECEALEAEQGTRHAKTGHNQSARREAFLAEQKAARENFSKSNPTENETRAFHEDQARQYRDFEGSLQQEREAESQANRKEYESKCGGMRHHEDSRPSESGYPKPTRPDDGSHEGPDEPCRKKAEAARGELEALNEKWDARMRAFHAEFDAARKEFSESAHNESDWKAFARTWESASRALHEEMRADMENLMDSLGLRECWERHGSGLGKPRPAERPMHGPPPTYDAHERPAPRPEEEAAFKIRLECEAKVRALMEELGASGNETTAREPSPEVKERAYEIWRDCQRRIRALYEGLDRGRPDDHEKSFGSFEMYFDESTGRIIVKGKHVTMEGVPEAQMMTNITVGGQLYVDRLFVKGHLAEFRPEQTEIGSAIQVYDSRGQRIISVHDNPRGVTNLAASAEIPAITLDLADYLQLERTPNGIRLTDGGREGIVLIHGGGVEIAEGNVLTVTGKATLVVAPEATGDAPAPVEKAILEKRLGADVMVTAEGGSIKVDSTPYGDLDVRVSKGGDEKVVVLVESEAGDGKTIVLRFDQALFASDVLKVGCVGVNEDGSESALTVREASNLEDVLDPLDDGEAVEYWIVSDKNGIQVLVSFPHFSEKKVTVESVEATALGALPGFEAVFGLLAVGVVAVGVGMRRRC